MIRNDLRKAKQIIHHSKDFDKAFLSNFGFFYQDHSPDMVKSRDLSCKFEIFKF